MSFNKIDFEWNFKRLELDTFIKPFESEDDELNDFLLNDAKNYLAQMPNSFKFFTEKDSEKPARIMYFDLKSIEIIN